MSPGSESHRGQSSITLRAAQPVAAEGRVYARYLDEVTEGFFRFRLGRSAVDILATAYLQPAHDLSYEHVTFAEAGHRIVAMAFGFTAAEQRGFSDQPLKRAAGRQAWRLRATGILAAPLLRILETIADGDFYILTVIADGDMRGEGLGSLLLDHLEERARSSGSTRVALDVAKSNGGARRLYERRGWAVESKWPAFPLLPTVFLRMTKPL